MWWVVGFCVLGGWIFGWVWDWVNPKCNGKLPPGNMGFPIIGETIQFFSPYGFYDIPPFIKSRITRFGAIFKTSIVGNKVVVSTDAEVNYKIFQQENKSFLIWYMESFIEIFGQQSLLAYHGMIHKYLKNLILHLVGPENLKANVIHEMDHATRCHLNLWASHHTIDVKEAASDMIFEYFSKKLIGYDEKKTSRKLRQNYIDFIEGLVSFPLNIPGTAYHSCLQGRKNAIKVIKEMLKERRSSKAVHNDFLDYLLKEVDKDNTILSEGIAVDLIFALLFATYETTSASITLLMKFISEKPQVLLELKKEHRGIVEKRENENSQITWEEYKSMTFTHMVINETVRLANIVPGVFRKVLEDVEVKGYTIPAGWIVMVVPSVLHLDPDKYENPLTFNPWR
ncbi:cytochrome P450 87A3-like, partial [Carica papaya]|uniref:cytochrome P450 87A3-like n=1 Tax=Carica papaya TaxID=3649 RepID=UPI000B8D1090